MKQLCFLNFDKNLHVNYNEANNFGALPWLVRERCLSGGHIYVPW